ncbi:uncharacterized protein LOC144485499 [Mustelus asterias]
MQDVPKTSLILSYERETMLNMPCLSRDVVAYICQIVRENFTLHDLGDDPLPVALKSTGMLKMHFKCLDQSDDALQYYFQRMSSINVLSCALHNLAHQRSNGGCEEAKEAKTSPYSLVPKLRRKRPLAGPTVTRVKWVRSQFQTARVRKVPSAVGTTRGLPPTWIPAVDREAKTSPYSLVPKLRRKRPLAGPTVTRVKWVRSQFQTARVRKVPSAVGTTRGLPPTWIPAVDREAKTSPYSLVPKPRRKRPLAGPTVTRVKWVRSQFQTARVRKVPSAVGTTRGLPPTWIPAVDREAKTSPYSLVPKPRRKRPLAGPTVTRVKWVRSQFQTARVRKVPSAVGTTRGLPPTWIPAVDREAKTSSNNTKVGGFADGDEDYQRTQQDMDRLEAGAERWQMEFNLDKCEEPGPDLLSRHRNKLLLI